MKSTRAEFQMPARPAVSPRGGSKLAAWVRGELIAAIGMSGAALTVFAELSRAMPTAEPVTRLLAQWRMLIESVWKPPFELAGLHLHPTLAAALSAAFFMLMIAIGGRIAAALTGRPMPPLLGRRFWTSEDQPWPSLIAFGTVCFAFLIGGTGGIGNAGQPPSTDSGSWTFAAVAVAGYLLGEYLGGREFHRRMTRVVVLVAVLAAVNFVLLTRAPPAP